MASTIQVDNIKDIGGNTMISSNGSGTFTNSLPAPTSGIAASAIDSGTIATARLGSGTASSSTFLRGDQTYAAPDSGGITMAQTWRLTTSFTGSAQPIASNLEAADTNSSGAIGSAMSVDGNGIFTFPSTGIWLIQSTGEFYYNGSSRYNQLITEVTTNNSSYSEASKNSAGITQAESSHTYNSCMTQIMLDVTNTTNVKVRFTVSVSVSGVSTAGSSDYNRTSFSFLRIGDT